MLLSFIIPTYNLQNFIVQTLKSVIHQTSNNYEIIIVDDGSTDKTVAEAKGILKTLEFIEYKIVCKENGGVSSARNAGIQEARGEYIIFLDGDDIAESELVSEINKILVKVNSNLPDVIFWKYDIVFEKGKIVHKYFDINQEPMHLFTGVDILEYILLKKMEIGIGSAAYRRETLLQNSLIFTEGCSNGEDQEFIYKFLILSKEIYFINHVLYHYILSRSDSISNSFNLKRFDATNAFRRVSLYASQHLEDKDKRLVDTISNIRVLEDFFYNLDACLNIYENKEWYKFKSAREIINKINLRYPGLIFDIIGLLKKTRLGDARLSRLKRIYAFSPYLYCYLRLFKKGFNKMIKRKL
jgi:glycosyltransferase involved in cell wall biosynthesis